MEEGTELNEDIFPQQTVAIELGESAGLRRSLKSNWAREGVSGGQGWGLTTIKNCKQKCAQSLRDSSLSCVDIGPRWYTVQNRWWCTKRSQQRPPNHKATSFLYTWSRSVARIGAERVNSWYEHKGTVTRMSSELSERTLTKGRNFFLVNTDGFFCGERSGGHLLRWYAHGWRRDSSDGMKILSDRGRQNNDQRPTNSPGRQLRNHDKT